MEFVGHGGAEGGGCTHHTQTALSCIRGFRVASEYFVHAGRSLSTLHLERCHAYYRPGRGAGLG